MAVFVDGVLTVLGSSMMLHMFSVVAVACGIMGVIKIFSIHE